MAVNFKCNDTTNTYKKLMETHDDYIIVCNMVKLERIHKLRRKMYRSGEEFTDFNNMLRGALNFIVDGLLAGESSNTLYNTLVNAYNAEQEVLSVCFEEEKVFNSDYFCSIQHLIQDVIWDAVIDIRRELEDVYSYMYE